MVQQQQKKTTIEDTNTLEQINNKTNRFE